MRRIIIFLSLLAFPLCFQAQPGGLKSYSLISDLPDTSATLRSIGMLLDSMHFYTPDQTGDRQIPAHKDGLIILMGDPGKEKIPGKVIAGYTRAGGTVVMDIRAYAAFRDYQTRKADMRKIIVRKESRVTSGYKAGEPVIYSGRGSLLVLDVPVRGKNLSVLAESETGDIVLVEEKAGKGKIIAVDMLSLPEPRYSLDSENKYLFLVNAVGNPVKYGRYFPKKLKHAEFIGMLEEFTTGHPGVKMKMEGDASGGYGIYSLNMGDPEKPGIFIYSCTHGNEWENAWGTFNFVRYLAEHEDQDIIDLDNYCLKVIPILNPHGYDNQTRQNANLVDLNRNGDHYWDKFTGEDPKNYKPGAYDWKGTAPFSEPESQTLRKAAASGNFIAFLDVHGNPSGTGYNKWMGVAANTKPDANEKAGVFREHFNNSISGRYILQQSREKYPKLMIIESISGRSDTPNLYNTIARDRYGYIVEFLCGYGNSTAFISMQDDIITELCVAFCKTFAP
jgi:hypothetical protein